MFRVGLYARVSTHDQQTLPLQMRAMREYAARRGWTVALPIKEVGSGAAERELRERLLVAARRRDVDRGELLQRHRARRDATRAVPFGSPSSV